MWHYVYMYGSSCDDLQSVLMQGMQSNTEVQPVEWDKQLLLLL